MTPKVTGQTVCDERARAVVARLDAAERVAAGALPSDDPLDPNRRFRTEATRPELLAQPDVVRRNWAANEAALAETAARIRRHDPDRVLLVGAGDSLAVMTAARLALESMLGVPCEPMQSLELAFYYAHDVTPRSLVVALSSSGETTRTVQALLVAQAAGAMTLALTNKPHSTLAAESTTTLLVDATRVGWPTQSSTAPLALLLRLAGLVGVARGVPTAAALLAELETVPELMADTLERADAVIAEQAAAERAGRMFLFAGAGPNHASAVVGAAKVKECTPDHAVAVQLEEFHHYNSQKAGEPLWLLVPSGRATARGVDTVHEAHRLGGHVYAVTTDGESAYDGISRDVLHLPAVTEALSPLMYFLPAQLVGYHLAAQKFASAESPESARSAEPADGTGRD
ncbi:SIS domain-containing protein [Actinacidiphila acididurans]|uniref:Glutamine--fructose-6-phosphate aminotransferase [isomerizing] n=1 Tax=Actinacidiphila acididurans TaxID=2784346 RepID=A0ABS2TLT3_9ACTN|nr:SIS domain-containing protein [Actinacidiphila acididurans]MBM9504027.1 SIS domain-containing protein [Actinacidiphila acididurans]